MIVTSQKIKTDFIPENACPSCDGVGKILNIAWNNRRQFETSCSDCNGEKIITQNLLDRQAKGRELRELMVLARLSGREASQRFGGQFILDWEYAKQGKIPLGQIQAKIDLVATLPQFEEVGPAPMERPKLKTNGEK